MNHLPSFNHFFQNRQIMETEQKELFEAARATFQTYITNN
jgi:hypothetical protein